MLIAAATAAASAIKPPAVTSNGIVTGPSMSASLALTRSFSLQSTSSAAAAAAAQAQIAANPNSSLCKLQAGNCIFDPKSAVCLSQRLYTHLNLLVFKMSELPIARRHSLQRFLEKRRDR
jgi:jasmonate ZIM domain-containing protein